MMSSSARMDKVLLVVYLRGRVDVPSLVTLVVVTIVGARHATVTVTTTPPGPAPAHPRYVEGLLR